MALVRTFRSRDAARTHRADVIARYALPRHYSRADLRDGTIREEGHGRHVDPARLVREPVPEVRVSATGKTWAVESTESERADTVEAEKLTEHDLSVWTRDSGEVAAVEPVAAPKVVTRA